MTGPRAVRVRKKCSSRHMDIEVATSSRCWNQNLTREVRTEKVTLEGISTVEVLGITKFTQGLCTKGGEKAEEGIDILKSSLEWNF